jgi:hypothetical protein
MAVAGVWRGEWRFCVSYRIGRQGSNTFEISNLSLTQPYPRRSCQETPLGMKKAIFRRGKRLLLVHDP